MLNHKKIFLTFFALFILVPMQSLAMRYNLGDVVPYYVVLSNKSNNPVIISGQTIGPKQSDIVVAGYKYILNSSTTTFIYPGSIYDLKSNEICKVTGRLVITLPSSLSLSAQSSNRERCDYTNGMITRDGTTIYLLRLTVR